MVHTALSCVRVAAVKHWDSNKRDSDILHCSKLKRKPVPPFVGTVANGKWRSAIFEEWTVSDSGVLIYWQAGCPAHPFPSPGSS